MSKQYPTVREFLSSPYDPGIERRFFEALSLPNRTFKSTHEHRLDDVNEAVWPHIMELASRPVKILDVAASSGISTVEWYEHLESYGLNFNITATDMIVKASLLTAGPISALVDADGKFLHLDVGGIGMRTSVNSIRRYIVAARTAFFSIFLKLAGSTSQKSVALVSRRFTANGQICMFQDDLFAPNPADFVRAFHVIRAANILNHGYFEKPRIMLALSILKERLLSKGLLIVCRTEPDSGNHGTIFQLENDTLVPIDRVGRGSEVEEVATSPLATSWKLD